MKHERLIGLVMVLVILLILTGLTTGFEDGSAAAKWCVQHSLLVENVRAQRGAVTSAERGQVCLDLYKEMK